MAEFSNDDIAKMILDVTQELFLQENKITTAKLLLPRLQQAALENRRDLTIRQICDAVERLASKNPTQEITPKEVEYFYNTFYTPGTKFKELFADFLSNDKKKSKGSSDRLSYFGESRDLSDVAQNACEVDEFDSMFENRNLVDKAISYSESEEPKLHYAALLCEEEIRQTNRISNHSLKLRHKTPNLLIYQAQIRTVAGDAEVFIPVELKEGNPLVPQVMATTETVYTLDQQGVDSLTEELIHKNYLQDQQKIAEIRIACGQQDDIRNDHYGEIEVDEFEFKTPQLSLGVEEIEQTLKNAIIRKESRFAEKIDLGRKLVEAELGDLGLTNSRVSFDGDFSHGLTYKCKLNTRCGSVDVSVPVEVENNKILTPTVFAIEDQIWDLNHQGLNDALAKFEPQEESDPRLVACSYPELKKQLKRSAHQRKPKLAKQILTIIAEKFDPYYFNASIDDYQTWLEEVSSVPTEISEVESEPIAIDVGNSLLL